MCHYFWGLSGWFQWRVLLMSGFDGILGDFGQKHLVPRPVVLGSYRVSEGSD